MALNCSAGQTTASVTINTDADWTQSNDGGTTWVPANTAGNSGWGAAPTGSNWIGNGTNGLPASAHQFLRVLQLGAGVDPAVPLTVDANFLADDTRNGLTVGGLSTGVSGGTYGAPTAAAGAVTLPSAGDYPVLASVTNTGGAYGVAMSMTVTATCRAAPPAPVPADAPWALGMLTGLIGLAAAAVASRRRRG